MNTCKCTKSISPQARVNNISSRQNETQRPDPNTTTTIIQCSIWENKWKSSADM